MKEKRASGLKVAGIAGLMALASAGNAVAATPGDPIRVGVLDLKADRLMSEEPNVKIIYQTFNDPEYKPGEYETASGFDHGVVVLTSTVRELRRLDPTAPIEVYAGNAFDKNPHPKPNQSLYAMNFERGSEALVWMHDHGVRVVVTAFNTKNEAGSKLLMDKAEELGMTVFAGASNDRGKGAVLPASDPRAISVADTTPDQSSLTKDKTVETWVKFAMNGAVSLKPKGETIDFGSSYASAKAGAYGAYYQWRNPDARREEIEGALTKYAVMKRYLAGSSPVHARTLGEDNMPWAFRDEAIRAGANRQLALLDVGREATPDHASNVVLAYAGGVAAQVSR